MRKVKGYPTKKGVFEIVDRIGLRINCLPGSFERFPSISWVGESQNEKGKIVAKELTDQGVANVFSPSQNNVGRCGSIKFLRDCEK